MPTIKISSLPKYLKRRVLQLRRLGFFVIIKNIGLDLSSVILVSVRDINGKYITCGIASSFDAENMINAALSEVEVTIMHLLNLEEKNKIVIKPENVEYLQQHEELYQQVEFSHETDFMFSSSNYISFQEFISKNVEAVSISKKVESLGFEILELDASDWTIDILLPEFRFVSKVIIPSLVPLSYGFNNEPLGMDRIYSIPKQLNLKRNELKDGYLNKMPHPFN